MQWELTFKYAVVNPSALQLVGTVIWGEEKGEKSEARRGGRTLLC
ncbi:MAG: hypothetical protein ACKERG_04300 [Candidatus Hodgkinia cicadicola]